MNNLCSIINNAYSSNFRKVILCFKKQYVYVLNKLVQANLILNYKIFKNSIEVNLKYFYNKPLFKLILVSKGIEKKNYTYQFIKKMIYKRTNKLNFFSTSYANLLVQDEIMFLKVGGLCILQVQLLPKNKII